MANNYIDLLKEIPEGLKLDGEVIVQYGQLIDGKIDGFGVIVVAQ